MKSLPLFYLPVSIGILVALLLSSCALTNCNDKDAPNLTDAVNGLLETQQKQREFNNDILEGLDSIVFSLETMNNETSDKFDLFQNEIIKIKQYVQQYVPSVIIMAWCIVVE